MAEKEGVSLEQTNEQQHRGSGGASSSLKPSLAQQQEDQFHALNNVLLSKLNKIAQFTEKLHQRLETVRHSIQTQESTVDKVRLHVSEQVRDAEALKSKFQSIQAPSTASSFFGRMSNGNGLGFDMNRGASGTRSSSGYFTRVAHQLEKRMNTLWRKIEDIENTLNTSEGESQPAPEMLQETLQRQQEAFLNVATKVALIHEEASYLRDTYKSRFVKPDGHDPFQRPKVSKKGVGYTGMASTASQPTLPGLTLPEVSATSGAPTAGNTGVAPGGAFNFGGTSTGGNTGGTSSTGMFNFGNTSTNTGGGTSSGGAFNFGGSSSTGGTSGGSSGFNFGGTSTGNTGGTSSGGFNFGSSGTSGTTGGTSGGFNFGGGGSTGSGGGFNFGGSSNTGSTNTGSSGGFNFGGTSTGNAGTGGSSGGFNFGGGSGNTGTSGFSFGSPSRKNVPPAIQT